MKKMCAPENQAYAMQTAETILKYLKGEQKPIQKNGQILITERLRQFMTWGAHAFLIIGSKCGCYGIQFHVSGLQFKGRVRIYYNIATDYFDVEFLQPRKDNVFKSFEDIDFMQLHNLCHQVIERTDDPEV